MFTKRHGILKLSTE